MSEEEYAIVSKKEFMKLKQELDKLKKNPLGESASGENLQESVTNLNSSLTGMMALFKEAADELKIEERDTQVVSKKIEPLTEKMDTLIEQNQKIAKGIVAIADMVKEKLEAIENKTSRHNEEKDEKHKLPPLSGGPRPEDMFQQPMNQESNHMNPPPMPGGPEFMQQPPVRSAPMPLSPPTGENAGFDMPSPMGPPPSPSGKRKPILGGFLSK